MSLIRKAEVIAAGLITLAGLVFNSPAHGQNAIAFFPGIGAIPSGATMTVTPAVSADRRYVRLTVEPFFNSLNGFTTFNVQGAVGANGGFGAFGGFGGLNGVMAGPGLGGAGGGMSPGGAFGLTGEPLAGPVPFGDPASDLGPPLGDPLNPSIAPLSNPAPEEEGPANPDAAVVDPAARPTASGQTVQSANQQLPRHRRTSAHKSSRRRSAPIRRSH
jgi:hypothetical protein